MILFHPGPNFSFRWTTRTRKGGRTDPIIEPSRTALPVLNAPLRGRAPPVLHFLNELFAPSLSDQGSTSGLSNFYQCADGFRPLCTRKNRKSGRLGGADFHRVVRVPLVFKAHRLFYHSTLGSRVINKKKGVRVPRHGTRAYPGRTWVRLITSRGDS